ncbi:MAG: NUDIX hydrolase [Gammaproteobacteria bacterium]
MTWNPHITVAAIAQQEDRFLMVEENVHGTLVINNPAGHLEDTESFVDAVRRETLEETGWEFEPDAVTGIYLWKNPGLGTTFLRIAFCGRCVHHHPERPLDQGIVGPRWYTRTELADGILNLRSPLVTRCLDDFLAGRRFPLELLTCLEPIDIQMSDARV